MLASATQPQRQCMHAQRYVLQQRYSSLGQYLKPLPNLARQTCMGSASLLQREPQGGC